MPSSLPPGWGEKFTAEGKPYYVDYNTKTTHWELPSSPSPVSSPQCSPAVKKKSTPSVLARVSSGTLSRRSSKSLSKTKILSRTSSRSSAKLEKPPNSTDQLPTGWQQMSTPDGKIFYVDNNTQTTHWELPMQSSPVQTEPSDVVDQNLSDVQKALVQGNISFANELLDICGTEEIDQTGKTLLHYVSLASTKLDQEQNLLPYVEFATKVRNSGVDINAEDDDGNTAFHFAVGCCAPDLMFWLICYAEMKSNKEGKTPLMLAEESITAAKGAKDDKKKLKRADGALFLTGKDGLFNFIPPKNFHCPGRFSLRTALMMALLAKMIYKGEGTNLGDQQSCGNHLVKSVLTRWGFSSIKIVEKNDARGMILEKEATEEMPRVLVIAFRGTKTKKDILTDLSANKRGGGTTHSGFQTHLNRISDTLCAEIPENETSPIYVTGHSLGGAMATIMMKKLHSLGFPGEQLHMYTFGQPRAGTIVFQSEFDSLFKDAYIIQRNLDPVPLVPTYSGAVVGGYVHSGSVRFLDSAGQLYNDLHYQYEDINRSMLNSIPPGTTPTPQELRTMWTGGLQQLNQQISICENSADVEAALGLAETESEKSTSGYIPQKSLKKKDTNVVFNMIKGRKDALLAHGMLGYLTDIALLESRVNKPFSWDNDPENAISSQLSEITLPADVYSEKIKGERLRLEQEVAYQHWIQYYVSLPGIRQYSLDSSISCGDIIPWIHEDGKVLLQLSIIEEAILSEFPTLQTDEEIPKTTKREDVSPLVEVGMYSVINLLTQMMKENENLGMTYYRWLYWSMPEAGYCLTSSTSSNSLTLQRSGSPYRKGIQNCMQQLSTNNSSLEELALALPTIAKADNGPYIAKVSSSIQKMRQESLQVRHTARVELSNLEFAIVGEMIAKFKKVGLKAGAYCAASGAVGAAAGIATGLAVAGVTGGVATPAAIIAGVAVGAGTTGTLIGVAAAKKVPKYLESLKSSLTSFEEHLLGIANAKKEAQKNQHRSSILKLCKNHKSRSRVVLYLINGLYINLTLAKLHNESILSSKSSCDSGTFIERQQESFFRKVLSLINLYIAVVKFDDDNVNSHLVILSKICKAIEVNVDKFRELFVLMGQELSVERPTVGTDLYRHRANVNESLGTLTKMITNQNHPQNRKAIMGDDHSPVQVNSSPKPPAIAPKPTWAPSSPKIAAFQESSSRNLPEKPPQQTWTPQIPPSSPKLPDPPRKASWAAAVSPSSSPARARPTRSLSSRSLSTLQARSKPSPDNEDTEPLSISNPGANAASPSLPPSRSVDQKPSPKRSLSSKNLSSVVNRGRGRGRPFPRGRGGNGRGSRSPQENRTPPLKPTTSLPVRPSPAKLQEAQKQPIPQKPMNLRGSLPPKPQVSPKCESLPPKPMNLRGSLPPKPRVSPKCESLPPKPTNLRGSLPPKPRVPPKCESLPPKPTNLRGSLPPKPKLPLKPGNQATKPPLPPKGPGPLPPKPQLPPKYSPGS